MPRQLDVILMRRAIAIARNGQGYVEPNPMVGCVVTQHDQVVGEGWHTHFGATHAEIAALSVAGANARGGTMYVTLEPCCHFGKTPPCVPAIVQAGIRRVVVAVEDPFPQVAGRGIAALCSSGVSVEVGLCVDESRRLIAPFHKLTSTGLPWLIAKWAMSLDGKVATRTGDSRWISNESSRRHSHALRGRVDAVVVGSGTVRVDDPLLTARPSGPRLATRVVVDSLATISTTSQLVNTSRDVPVLIAVGPDAEPTRVDELRRAGCEVFAGHAATHLDRIEELLLELGRRRMTNVLVEGGARLLGNLFDARAVDEVHVYIGPIIVGGAAGISAVLGAGLSQLADGGRLSRMTAEPFDGDIHIHALVDRD